MRGLRPPILLLAIALLAAPRPAAAGPLERVQRLSASAKWDDAAQVARRWLERNADDAEAEAMRGLLAEAAYQLLLSSPSVARTQGWREEFGDAPRRDDVDSLEANLRLYAAAEQGTEAAYLEVADAWPGTAAAREARGRAEALAFEAARADGSASALSAFLGAYDGLAHEEEALDLWRVAAWTAAQGEDTARAWRELRMQDPDHPRADEALLLEQQAALRELGEAPSAADLMQLARRYPGGPAGWEALRRATDHAVVRVLAPDGVLLLEDVLGPATGPAAPPLVLGGAAAIEVVHEGRLPLGATVDVSLVVTIEDRPVPWARAAFRQAARWGVRSEAPSEDGATARGAFTTDRPLCAGDLLQTGQLVVTVADGEESAAWVRPVRFEGPCAGPLPWAARRTAGAIQSLRRADTLLPVGGAVPIAGTPWPCAGPLLTDASGVLIGCGEHRLRPFAGGWIVAAAPDAREAFEDDASPWLDALPGDGWAALDVPDAWHFGGAPTCPLPAGSAGPREEIEAPPEASAAEPGEPSPDAELLARPAWLAEDAPSRAVDLDGDGAIDGLATSGVSGRGQLILWGGPLAPGEAWVSPWPRGVDPAAITLRREGCSLSWGPPG
jgi:hypothetical protein